MNKSIWHGAYQYQVWRYDNNVSGRIHQLRTFMLFVHLRRWAASLLFWLFFLPLCCACWRLTSNVKIGTTAGKIFYVHCFRPFSKRNQGKKEKRHQSASVDSHSAPVFFCLVCFLSRCFFVAAFTLFAPFQLGLNLYVLLHVYIFICVSFHVSCVTSLSSVFPSIFFECACVARNTWRWADLL